MIDRTLSSLQTLVLSRVDSVDDGLRLKANGLLGGVLLVRHAAGGCRDRQVRRC